MGHGSGAALFQRQAGLRPVERLDLAFLVDEKDDGMGRRVNIESDDIAHIADSHAVSPPGIPIGIQMSNWNCQESCVRGRFHRAIGRRHTIGCTAMVRRSGFRAVAGSGSHDWDDLV
jgi:hypothetical protein